MTAIRYYRRAITLIELLVVMAVISVMIGLLLPAVQKVRASAQRSKCQSQMKQIVLGLIQYHDNHQVFPPGHRTQFPDRPAHSDTGWTMLILPLIEQPGLATEIDLAFQLYPNIGPYLAIHSKVVPLYICPADDRLVTPRTTRFQGDLKSFTSYLVNSGISGAAKDGVFFDESKIRFANITDGTSQTLMLGERPPPRSFDLGHWFTDIGIDSEGTAGLHLGVIETLPIGTVANLEGCVPGTPYSFRPTLLDDPCTYLHHWSMHPTGANFAFCDGSVRFLIYSVNDVLPALATRAGGESVAMP